MNVSIRRAVLVVSLVFALGSSAAQAASFTYHGSLKDGGQPASGRYDLRLTPYRSEKAVAPLAEAVTLYGVEVKDGRFSTEVDFGDVAVNEGWIGVAVRKAGGGDYAELAGRSEINAAEACWSTTGNAGMVPNVNYLGTSDSQPLIFGVNGIVAGNFAPAVGGGAAALSVGSSWADGPRAMAMGNSEAHAPDSFGGGKGRVQAGHDRSFVWGGSGRDYSYSGAADQFVVGADGGFFINANQSSSMNLPTVTIAPMGTLPDVDIWLQTGSGANGGFSLKGNDSKLFISAAGGVHVVNPVSIDGSLAVAGGASKSTAGAWRANSDGRIKQDIVPVEDALDTLAKVHPVSFRYTDAYRTEHPEVADQRYYNVIAQQFAEVFPDAVTKSGEYLPGAEKTADNEILQVDTYPAQIVTIAAVQELAQKNAALEAMVQKLTARLAKLEAKGK